MQKVSELTARNALRRLAKGNATHSEQKLALEYVFEVCCDARTDITKICTTDLQAAHMAGRQSAYHRMVDVISQPTESEEITTQD